MGREPLFCVVRCDAQQIGARKPQFFNEKIADVRDRLKGQIQSLLADDKFDINGLDPDGLDLCRPAIADVDN